MKYKLFKTTTSKLIPIFIQNTTSVTGAGLTGLTYASAGLSWYYLREGAAAPVAVTLANMTVGTWASGGFKEIDATNMPGFYQVGVPDAAIATGANSVSMVFRGATNMVPRPVEIELDAINYQDAVRAGLTALPNAADGAAGGLTTIITAVPLAVWNTLANVAFTGSSMGALVVANLNAAVGSVALAVWNTLANVVFTTSSMGALLVSNLNAIVGNVASNVWSVDTRALTDKADFTLTSAYDPAKTAAQAGNAMSLTSSYDAAKTAAQAGNAMALTVGERTTLAGVIWNSVTSAFLTAGSIGKKLADWVVGQVSSFATTVTVDDIISSYMGVTELQLKVEQRLRRPADSTSLNYTAAVILEALNDAYVRWFRLTLDATRTVAITTTIDVPVYTLPDDVYQIREVWYDNVLIDRTTESELTLGNPSWREDDSGSPYQWARSGNLGIRIYPAPSDSSTLSVIANVVPTVQTIPVTTGAIALMDGSNDPVIPSWTQQALVSGAVSYLVQNYLFDDPLAQQIGALAEVDFVKRVDQYKGTKVN
jgi:hypothetical protein